MTAKLGDPLQRFVAAVRQRSTSVKPMTDGAAAELDALRAHILELVRVEPGRALKVAEQLEEATRGRLTAEESAVALRLRAHALRSVGQARKAEALYARAWAAFERLGDSKGLTATAIGWIDVLGMVGRPERAKFVVRRARKVLGRGDADARAKLEANLGNVWFALHRHREAANCYRTAKRRFARLNRSWERAICDFNLGKIHLREGRPRAAARCFEAARTVYAAEGLTSMRVEAEVGLAATELFDRGWAAGRQRLESLHGMLLELGNERSAADVQRFLADILLTVGAPELAERFASQSHRNYDRLQLDAERAQVAFLHGRILAQLSHHHDAHVQLSRAAAYWRKTNNAWARRRAQVEAALAQLERNDAAGCLRSLRGVADYLEGKQKGAGARARWISARACLQLGRVDRAERHARRAFAEASRHPFRSDRPGIALTLAQAMNRRGRSDWSVRWARKAIAEFEKMTPDFGETELRLGMRWGRTRIYGDAMEIILSSGFPRALEIVFELLLQAKSRALLDEILHRSSSSFDRRTRLRISQLRQLIEEEPGADTDDVRFRANRGELRTLEERVRSRPRPRGPAQWFTHKLGPALDAIATQGRELVVYQHTPDGWLAFVRRVDGQVHRIALSGAEQTLADHWVSLRMMFEAAASLPAAARERFLERSLGEAEGSLDRMRSSLVDPLELLAEEAYFVPTETLHGVPIECLVHPAAGPRALRRLAHPLLLRPTRRSRQREVLFLRGQNLGTQEEARSVRRILAREGYDVLVGERPEQLNRSTRLGVLHIAAHGAFHRRQWLLSGFRLAGGWLGFEDLRPGSLRGALVVFGSCESAVGRVGPGAELGGWIASAISAGAREMVFTLWKVDDASSIAFSEAFYRAWAAGRSAQDAAASARSEARKQHPHPFCWAPYMAIG